MAQENGDAPSELEKKIIRQVEYYFGDINLPRDKFLQEQTRADNGWVTMDVMLKFNRLKSISDDKEVICKALKKSSSGLMEVNEDLTKIRRCPEKPLPDNTKERREELSARSVYVKGFPEDSTLDGLMDYFEQYGKIDTILMRRHKPTKEFKGSVFVTFNNTEDEDKFLAMEGLKYNETELIKMKKEDYFQKKTDEEKQRKKNAAGSDKDQKKAEVRKEEEDKKVEDQMTKGAVMFVKGLPKDTSVEDIKTFFNDFAQVAWVEFASGDEKALLRFNEAEAQAALDKAKAAGDDGKVIMKDCELELRVLEGEEEKEYWRKMFRDIADRKLNRKKQGSKGYQNRKRKFGGRPNKHGNRDDDDESPKKKAKTAEEDRE
ncbi:lupus La protein-like [Babylonia areolata]|uniref:lupus La protein-like n=1 Tax=Babylonia areolata TaxID=304850 RepID=UPI003FD5F05E